MPDNEGAAVLGLATEAFKACIGAVKDKDEKTAKTQARGGPLVTLGRLYLSLVLILAVCASTSAMIDWKTSAGHSGAIDGMRYAVLGFAVVGLLGAVDLVIVLYRENPLLLSSPSEMGASLQEQMTPKTPGQPDKDIGKAPSQGSPPTQNEGSTESQRPPTMVNKEGAKPALPE